MITKEIDIYFISGQSNASGSTKIVDADALIADYPALEGGTAPYILYAGNPSGNTPNNSATFDWCGVRPGLGTAVSKMGPEVGMAYSLSKYYNEKTGKVAGLIKYAHGGTGFCHTEVNTPREAATGRYPGNWTPASYETHHPEDPDLAYKGFLYRGFVQEAKKRLGELKEMGYTKINIKGLYWMQGCNDTWRYTTGEETEKRSPRWYPEAFACLVSDWRREVSQIMCELQGNHSGAADMPFLIGTISPSYRLGSASAKFGDVYTDNGEYLTATRNRNDPFIAMQRKLAEDNPNCHIIDNSAYLTARYTENGDGTVTYEVVGTDIAHWGQADCYQIGKNVGDKLLSLCTDYQG